MGFNGKDVRGSKNPNYKTGLKTANSDEKFYNAWQGMKQRCLNPKHPKYSRYGGRGITVCEEWLSVRGFYNWAIDSGWEKGMTIDRIDNDGNYCPENCKWVSCSENSRKKSTTKISYNDAQLIRNRCNAGEDQYSLAKEYNVTHGTIWFIAKGFTHVPDGECSIKLKERGSKK